MSLSLPWPPSGVPLFHLSSKQNYWGQEGHFSNSLVQEDGELRKAASICRFKLQSFSTNIMRQRAVLRRGKKKKTVSSWDFKDFYLRCWHMDLFCKAMSLFLNSIDRKQQMAKWLENAFILWFIFTKTLPH